MTYEFMNLSMYVGAYDQAASITFCRDFYIFAVSLDGIKIAFCVCFLSLHRIFCIHDVPIFGLPCPSSLNIDALILTI